MHVREWGDQEGQPLVFWHALGAGTSGAYLIEVAPSLTEAGLRVIAPDAPGFGRSPALPPERYRIESLLELLEALPDERGIERALFMGHSWGGTLVTAFAAKHSGRVEGLVLVDSGHMDHQDAPGFPHGRSRGARQHRDARSAGRRHVRRHAGPCDGQLRRAIAAADIPILLLLATEPPETRAMNERAAETFARRLPVPRSTFSRAWATTSSQTRARRLAPSSATG